MQMLEELEKKVFAVGRHALAMKEFEHLVHFDKDMYENTLTKDEEN